MIERVKLKPKRRLYKRRTAAEVLDTSVTKLKALEREGRLTPIRLGDHGRDVHYTVEQVEALADGDATE